MADRVSDKEREAARRARIASEIARGASSAVSALRWEVAAGRLPLTSLVDAALREEYQRGREDGAPLRFRARTFNMFGRRGWRG